MRKENSNSTLGSLPAHQRDQLISWLIEERIPVPRAVLRVKDDFNVITSETAMYRFYQRHCAPRELLFAAEAASALKESSGGLTEDFDESSEQYLKQKYFELLASPERVNPKELIAFGQLIRQGQALAFKQKELSSKESGFRLKYEQKEREMTLAREKFEEQRQKAAAELEKLRKPDADRMPEAERAAILDKVDDILGIRKKEGAKS